MISSDKLVNFKKMIHLLFVNEVAQKDRIYWFEFILLNNQHITCSSSVQRCFGEWWVLISGSHVHVTGSSLTCPSPPSPNTTKQTWWCNISHDHRLKSQLNCVLKTSFMELFWILVFVSKTKCLLFSNVGHTTLQQCQRQIFSKLKNLHLYCIGTTFIIWSKLQ